MQQLIPAIRHQVMNVIWAGPEAEAVSAHLADSLIRMVCAR